MKTVECLERGFFRDPLTTFMTIPLTSLNREVLLYFVFGNFEVYSPSSILAR